MFSFVVATDKNGVMGSRNGGLPWGKSQKADLKRYRELTEHHTIIMGRTTFDELSEPLPNRHHVVITHKPNPSRYKLVDFMTFEQSIAKYRFETEEIFVIGGSKVFDLFLPYAQLIYLTIIDAEYNGDIFFSDFDKTAWKQVYNEHFNSDEKNRHSYTFMNYKRN
jgi:dihydrofolate reductase